MLGVLPPEAWRAARARAEVDGDFARRVRAWEERLAPLNEGFAPADPPPHLWPRIEAAVFGSADPAARPQARPASRWRRWLLGGALGGALAAALAVVAVLLPPEPEPLVAQLQSDQVAFEAVYDGEALRIARNGPPADSGHDYELWAIGADGVPRSLGVLREAQMRLNSDLVAAGVTLAVSLEPEGGSPADGPTGPVLAAAVLAALD